MKKQEKSLVFTECKGFVKVSINFFCFPATFLPYQLFILVKGPKNKL